MRYFRILLITD